jgi:hypothetical protein
MSKSQNLDSVRKTLANTPEILRQILAGVSREQMDWKASAERWAISEILTHLIVVDEQVAGLRAKRIFLEDNPRLASYDQIEAYQAGVFRAMMVSRCSKNLPRFGENRLNFSTKSKFRI